MKKVLKVIGIIAAVAGAIFGVYVIVKKYVDSKKVVIGNDAENYVSCSCCDDNFVSETVALKRVFFICFSVLQKTKPQVPTAPPPQFLRSPHTTVP